MKNPNNHTNSGPNKSGEREKFKNSIEKPQDKIAQNLGLEQKLEEILCIGEIIKILNDGVVIGTLGLAKIDPEKPLLEMLLRTTEDLGIGRIDELLCNDIYYGGKKINEIYSLKDLEGNIIFGEYGAIKILHNINQINQTQIKAQKIKLEIGRIKQVMLEDASQPKIAFLEGETGIAIINTENFSLQLQIKDLKEIGKVLLYVYYEHKDNEHTEGSLVIKEIKDRRTNFIFNSYDVFNPKKFPGLIIGDKNLCIIEKNGEIRWQTGLKIGKIRKIFFEGNDKMAIIGEKGIAKVDLQQKKYNTTEDLGIGGIVTNFMFPYNEIFKNTIDSSQTLNLIIGTKGICLIEKNELKVKRTKVFKEEENQKPTGSEIGLKRAAGKYLSHDKFLLVFGESSEGKKGLCCIDMEEGKVLREKNLSGRLQFEDIKTPFGPAVMAYIRDKDEMRSKKLLIYLKTGVSISK